MLFYFMWISWLMKNIHKCINTRKNAIPDTTVSISDIKCMMYTCILNGAPYTYIYRVPSGDQNNINNSIKEETRRVCTQLHQATTKDLGVKTWMQNDHHKSQIKRGKWSCRRMEGGGRVECGRVWWLGGQWQLCGQQGGGRNCSAG